MKPLTPRQREVLAYVSASIAERGYPPTAQEIADHFRFASVYAARCHLMALRRKGCIEFGPKFNARAIVITPHGVRQLPSRLVSVRQPWRCPECEAWTFADHVGCAEARKEAVVNKHTENLGTLCVGATAEVCSRVAGVQ